MPRIIETEVGKIVHRRKVKTAFDKFIEAVGGFLFFCVVFGLIGAFFG
ncbi:hypothetical protein I5535_10615 [Rhodobacteraceae bacterium F11138]|nr:hypothetical protein [Rhodobacteraceae bacterium F11138]